MCALWIRLLTVIVLPCSPCSLIATFQYSDEITLTFGQQGHVISLSYTPLVSPLAPKSCDELSAPSSAENPIKFNTNVAYEAAVPGMVLKTILPHYQPPPGLKFISDKPKGGPGAGAGSRTGGGGGEGKPDGFGGEGEKQEDYPNTITGMLQKYWYILLPLLIMNLISVEPPQEEGQQQGQGGGGGQAGARAPSGGGGGGAASKRRGKRG